MAAALKQKVSALFLSSGMLLCVLHENNMKLVPSCEVCCQVLRFGLEALT